MYKLYQDFEFICSKQTSEGRRILFISISIPGSD